MIVPGLHNTLATLATLAALALRNASANGAHAGLAGASSPALWYLTRAAAISAYALLSLTAMLGLLRSLARARSVRAPWVIVVLDDAHQFSALLTAGFLALHLGTLVLDPFLPFSLGNLLWPGGEPYRPLATGIGVLALWAMGSVLVSSWLRRRLSYGFWRSLHFLSFVAFILVTVHGLLAGSDAGQEWVSRLYLFSALGVGTLVVLRVLLPPQGSRAVA